MKSDTNVIPLWWRAVTEVAQTGSPTQPAGDGLLFTQEVTEPGDTSQLVLEMVKQARLVGSSVWATTTKSGRPRRARVDQLGDYLFLSALQEGEPPLYSHTLPVSVVSERS